MVTSHLPNTSISDTEDVDFYQKALYLIDKGYPVPTKDPEKLAKIIEAKEKDYDVKGIKVEGTSVWEK